MFGFSFPPFSFSPLVFFAFAFLLFQFDNCSTYRQVFSRMYLLFFSWEILSVSWIALSGFREGADTFLIIGGALTILIHTLFFVFCMMFLFFVRRNISNRKFPYLYLWFVPPIWIAHEYFQLFGQLNFPWLFLGYSHTYDLHKIQYIEFTGMFGISYWICLIGCITFYIVKLVQSGNWNNSRLKIITLAVAVVVIYFIPDFYNLFSDAADKYRSKSDEGTVNIGIVQPNINPWKKWGAKQEDLITNYLNLSSELISKDSLVQLIIFPETALPFHFSWDLYNEKYLMIKNYVDSIRIPMLVGSADIHFYRNSQYSPPDAKQFSNGQKYDTFNSAILVEPGKDKNTYIRHNKFKLVAGSERMPYQHHLSFLKSLVKWSVGLSSFQIGQDTLLFDLPGSDKKFNVAICYESVYPDFFARYVNMGADFSVIITNDGWWGKFFGTYQHNQYAVLRAIENRRWIARCANTGISCFIDPYGNQHIKTQIDETTTIGMNIGVVKEKTFYTKNGDIAGIVSAYICGVLFLVSIVAMVKRKVI
ncbi:MAG: apolipoprotein N-acyltransferase [Ignavibacteriaceae bacterium]|nr:apolipoprotein N-acyltransferase [Ignavibacteriaceae bacterium]